MELNYRHRLWSVSRLWLPGFSQVFRPLNWRSHTAVALQQLRWLPIEVSKLNGQYCWDI